MRLLAMHNVFSACTMSRVEPKFFDDTQKEIIYHFNVAASHAIRTLWYRIIQNLQPPGILVYV